MHRSTGFPIQHNNVRHAEWAWEARDCKTQPDATGLMKTTADSEKVASFEEIMLPHLDAAYNLARWITRNDADAQDVVQETYVRALRFFDSFTGGNGRGWLLAIVRHTCYSWMQRNRLAERLVEFNENEHTADCVGPTPEAALLLRAERDSLELCIRELPAEFREVIIMRELEGLSYKELAVAAEVPVGTIMSRLARARKRLAQCIVNRTMGTSK
jgi:RNA polymerase sigma factor (sigma-70 family)